MAMTSSVTSRKSLCGSVSFLKISSVKSETHGADDRGSARPSGDPIKVVAETGSSGKEKAPGVQMNKAQDQGEAQDSAAARRGRGRGAARSPAEEAAAATVPLKGAASAHGLSR